MDAPAKKSRPRLVTALMEMFGLSLGVAFVVAGLMVVVGVLALTWCIRSAPPRTIVMTTGPGNSTFAYYADAYAKELAVHGVKLKMQPSHGSLENLDRLAKGEVDVGFVQGGLVKGEAPADLVSLGSVSYQPMLVFYRSASRMALLSELAGKRIAVGPVGSGTHDLAVAMLQANGIAAEGTTTFVDLDADAAASALIEKRLDAVFLMGDSAPLPTLRKLLHEDGVQLYSFTQADAYVRRRDFRFLNRLVMPQGAIDLGKNFPAENVVLVGPTVELIARKGFHPALSDLLLKVAQKVHGNAGMFQRQGEFPAPLKHEFNLSDDAVRYYKSGEGFAYRMIRSFWLASMVDRVVVVFVPMLLVLIPTVRLLPVAYRWQNQLKIYRCYRPLLRLERDASASITAEQRRQLLGRLDEVEEMVNRLKVPASFAEQFYVLRGHIDFVRAKLGAAAP
jgi:TRAP transporter TAXI family solute receptor